MLENTGNAVSEQKQSPELEFGFLVDHVIHHYRMLGLDLTRIHAKRFKDTPMERGVGKITTLMLIAQNPGLTQVTIANAINKDKAAMARIVDELEREGLIVRHVAPNERRAYSLAMTDKGVQELRAYQETTKLCEQEFTDGLTEVEKDQFLRLLRKIRRLRNPDSLGIEAKPVQMSQ